MDRDEGDPQPVGMVSETIQTSTSFIQIADLLVSIHLHRLNESHQRTQMDCKPHISKQCMDKESMNRRRKPIGQMGQGARLRKIKPLVFGREFESRNGQGTNLMGPSS